MTKEIPERIELTYRIEELEESVEIMQDNINDIIAVLTNIAECINV